MSDHAEHAGGGHHDHHQMSFFRKYIFSTDHKIIGLQFLFSTLIFMVLGGLLAGAIRWQVAFPDAEFPVIGKYFWADNANQMSDEAYTMVVSMHASIMIFFVIIPLLAGAFGNYLIPLQIGYKDMAFPLLNALSYWFMWPAFTLIVASFFVKGGAASAGWTSYPPLSVVHSAAPGSGWGQTLWYISLLFVGISSMMGSINYITTIINCRAPGMTMFRLPMTTWSLLITAMLQAFALPVLTVALIMGLTDNLGVTGFFIPENLEGNWIIGNDVRAAVGGQPLLWQHLFWFYSHPAVYIMILPAMGMVSDVISTHARKPLFGYKPMVYSVAGIAGLGFIVWGHHMFMSGMAPMLGATFMVTTMFIALPSAVKVFNWISTMWQGNIQFNTPMLNAMAFVSMFIIGGLSGVYMAATPVDIHIHDTYYIVAHIHYVLFGGSLFGIFAGIYHWFPKMFGKKMNEGLGKLHFALSFICFNLVFYPMHILGVMGMPRRYADPIGEIERSQSGVEGIADIVRDTEFLNTLVSHSAFLLLGAQVIFALNFFGTLLFKRRTGERNPWNAISLEWTAASPPPHGNFDEVPKVYHGPYEYSHPATAQDFLPQDERAEDEALADSESRPPGEPPASDASEDENKPPEDGGVA